jgi:RNA polymerase sigma-70 factor (ECF subfamily)
MPVDNLTPERIFEQHWAATLIESALERLRNEFGQSGTNAFFDELRGYLWGQERRTPVRETAARFGMSEGAVRSTLFRLRQRFRELVRMEIAHTVPSEAEIDDAIRHLASLLSS